MTTHVFGATANSETETTVFWQCRVCGRGTNLVKDPLVDPHASMFEYPDNIDAYLDPCPGKFVGDSRLVSKEEMLRRLSTEEIGGLSGSDDPRIGGVIFKLQNQNEIDLNDPSWYADMLYAESIGILEEGRSTIICQ
jgi:hypothetical protein